MIILALGHFAKKKGKQISLLNKKIMKTVQRWFMYKILQNCILEYSPKSHDFQPAFDLFRYLHEDLILKGSSKIFF